MMIPSFQSLGDIHKGLTLFPSLTRSVHYHRLHPDPNPAPKTTTVPDGTLFDIDDGRILLESQRQYQTQGPGVDPGPKLVR
jgi:hypothetical protein